ncbi:MAG: precorrin-6A/cobalt-precorrin-6A reductase [Eubacteriaceae bacterium]|jgi:precorrin-6x reductase|nr:precorrin-6A/cobalt-precorrin-6A reductase [Eubacteriaceae bacterium]MDK2961269.1 precorrin-6A/cobalt-precorrin-6A reductase [Eubacteriaceae bacterium]
MARVLVIAGTADAMQVINRVMEKGHQVFVSITNRMSLTSLDRPEKLQVYQGKINKQNFTDLIKAVKPNYIIDASNPYSGEITKNVMAVSEEQKLPYIRFLREQPEFDDPDIIKVESHRQACDYLNQQIGNILLTIGSNRIETYTCIDDYKERVCLRVLPDSSVISKCEKIGFSRKNLVAMRGPFNETLNREIFKFLDAKFLVTKESGNIESVMEKIKAAKSLGMKVVLIERRDVIARNQTASIEKVLDFIR